jgi:hypothetical protein
MDWRRNLSGNLRSGVEVEKEQEMDEDYPWGERGGTFG